MCPKYYRPAKNYTNNKGLAWLYSEVCALLDVWADDDIQQQLGGRLHNMCVYEKISKRLSALGIDRTAEQCREKIKKLKRDYKTVMDNNYSTAFARKLLGCYDKVHEVFGKCAVIKPSTVIESITFNEERNNTSRFGLTDDSVSFNETRDMNHDDTTSDSSNSEYSDEASHLNNELSQYFIKDETNKEYLNEFKKSCEHTNEQILNLYKTQYQTELTNVRNHLQQYEKSRKVELQQEYKMYETFFSTLINQKYSNHANDHQKQ